MTETRPVLFTPHDNLFVPALKQLGGEVHSGPLPGGNGVGDQDVV
jgi:hypothetical protein